MTRRTSRDLTDSILQSGEVLESHNTTLVVKAFGHLYRIENANSRKPTITLMKGKQNDRIRNSSSDLNHCGVSHCSHLPEVEERS